MSHPTHPKGMFQGISPRCKNMKAYLRVGSHRVSSQLGSTRAISNSESMGFIHDWGTTFKTKEPRTVSHWISTFYYDLLLFD